MLDCDDAELMAACGTGEMEGEEEPEAVEPDPEAEEEEDDWEDAEDERLLLLLLMLAAAELAAAAAWCDFLRSMRLSCSKSFCSLDMAGSLRLERSFPLRKTLCLLAK